MTIDERIATELRRHTPEVDQTKAWRRIETLAPAKRREVVIRRVAVSLATAGLVVITLVIGFGILSEPPPVAAPQSPLAGHWTSTDLDESSQSMTVEISDAGVVTILVFDDLASVCSGAPSTLEGTGTLTGDTEFTIPQPVLTCDDGSFPEAMSGPPLDEQLRNLTFIHDRDSDTLSDSLGSVWTRAGESIDSGPESAASPIWPQTSFTEAQAAQQLADSGDPEYTWQLETDLEARLQSGDPAIFERFVREELGWEAFTKRIERLLIGQSVSVIYVRCAPGLQNSVYPHDPYGGMCVPTIDSTQYEAVEISVTQPVRRGPSGIWVVTGLETLEPIHQVTPISETEAEAILTRFLEARINGSGAEQYFIGDDPPQLLYATRSGSAFERYEFDQASAPAWPDVPRRYDVRLFAEDGQTVVEASFSVEPDAEGNWGIEIRSDTFENGESLGDRLYDILGGEVMFMAGPDWEGPLEPSFQTNGMWADANLYLKAGEDEGLGLFRVLADPLQSETGCDAGSAAESAEELAQNVRSLPGYDVTMPVAASIGGAPAIRMDVTGTGISTGCDEWLRLPIVSRMLHPEDPGGPARLMRLYLVDLPGGMARILAITIVAPEDIFDSVMEKAYPILESFSFHTG